jgi:uncharacterized SAM-dependent methyltransferase
LPAKRPICRTIFPACEYCPLPQILRGLLRSPRWRRRVRASAFFRARQIGNFEPAEAENFLRHAARILGHGAHFVVGVDLIKDPNVLHAAYNDAAGVTARFNLNLLARINRELGANFNLGAFEHRALFDDERSRIEMHLVSRARQRVSVCGRRIEFETGETIHTECSYKYTLPSFGALARRTGWTPVQSWTDERGYFSVHALALRDRPQ